MKHLLAALLCLLTLSHAHGQAWPRNPTTGKVEFRGTLPWPAGVKTEAQRRALVRRWYLAKLTDESAQAVDEGARTSVSPTLLTYTGLPTAGAFNSSKLPSHSTLVYGLHLTPATRGLTFLLAGFFFSRATDSPTALGQPLEQVLAADSAADRPALNALRRRLGAAVAHW